MVCSTFELKFSTSERQGLAKQMVVDWVSFSNLTEILLELATFLLFLFKIHT